ncbi:autotransporter domain-containing protein [Roseibium sp. SCP14]|uniref:autotransporter domain-containing protein n=1 Tax=Roseibium sp. SCP14 TaxID=3141375 RepID=UPI00333DF093
MVRGGRLVKRKGGAASIAPSLFLASVSVLALSAGAVLAEEITSTETTPVTFFNDEDNTITSTGEVNLTTGAAPAVTIDLDYSSTFTNEGTVTIEGASIPTATGVFLDGRLEASGQITNNNLIKVEATNGTAANAYGLRFSETFAGTFSNTGTIESTATATKDRAYAYGIYFDETVEASAVVVNSGSVTVETNSDDDYSVARGFYFQEAVESGVQNIGTITVKASSNNDYAQAQGMYFRRAVNGDISNSGEIKAVAEGGDEASAAGLFLIRELNGNFTNSGTIRAQATSPGEAYAFGLYASGEVTGNITNDHVIDISANAGTGLTAAAVYISNDLTGDIRNSGSITVAASSDTDDVPTYGLYLTGNMTGNILNSGKFTVEGEVTNGTGSAEVEGFLIEQDLEGNVDNTGTIAVSATSAMEDAQAFGLHVEGETRGNLTNSGDIEINANAETSALAAGYYLETGLQGNFENAAMLQVDAKSETDQAKAYGLYVEGDMTGDIVNLGTVDVQAEGLSSAAASGFYISDQLDGNFNNSGTLTVITKSQTSEADAYGLYVGSLMTGDIANSGTIKVQGSGDSSDTAAGVYVAWDLNGNFNNSGSIIVELESKSSEAEVYGVRVSDNMNGSISNSGTVKATAISGDEALTAGFHFGDTLFGDFENAGSINASATVEGDIVEVYGAYFGIDVSGNVTNSGTITGRAEGFDEVTAAGIFIDSDLTGELNNTGTIAVAAISEDSDAYAYGIHIGGDIRGSFNNSGTISAQAEGSRIVQAYAVYLRDDVPGSISNTGFVTASVNLVDAAGSAAASAAAFRIDTLDGEFANTGTLNATASGGSAANAYGLYIENHNGTITEVGTISATSESGEAYAIYLDGGTGTLNIDSKDDVTGTIRVADHDVNLDAIGGSAIFVFEDANTAGGDFTTKASDGRSAWYVQDEGGSNPVYAVVDPAELFTSSDVVASYGNVVGSISQVLTYGAAPQTVPGALAYDDPKARPQDPSQEAISSALATNGKSDRFASAFRPFVIIDAEAKRFDTDQDTDTVLVLANAAVGYTGQLENGLSLALGLGAYAADGNGDTTSFDTTGVYVNAAAGHQFGGFTVQADLGVGYLTTYKTRDISGSSDAKSNYNSTLLTAHIGAERAFQLGGGYRVLGLGGVRYTRQTDDDYTETGSSANATVSSATTEVVDFRTGIELEKSLGRAGSLKGRLSGVVRRGLGDTTADVTVLSSTQALTYAASDFTGASVQLGYEKSFSPNLHLNVIAEQEIGNDAQGPFVKAGLNWFF